MAARSGLLGSLLARLVLCEQNLDTIDIALLTALAATAEQHDQCFTVLRQVQTVTRAPVDHVLAHPVEPFHAGGVAQLQPQLGGGDLRRGARVEAIEPRLVGIRAVFPQVLFNADGHI